MTYPHAPLPIDSVLCELRTLLARGDALLQAPPGAGKTTRVPLALLDEPWLAGRKILMLEPRRLAAKAAAERMAAELGERVGETVGYRIRFESRVSARSRIEVVTEGILTRRLQGDPGLEGVGVVIFDEFHERHLHSDLALALCLDAKRSLREDLRLLVMSATLDAAPVAALLHAGVVTSSGRSFPVEVHYLPRDAAAPMHEVMRSGILRALAATEGDILAFLPGAGEIRRTLELLSAEVACRDLALHGLYGDLPFAAQEAAIEPDRSGRRKVVLATAIAETSLTIEGVRVVVDSGWSRVPRFDPNSGLTRLETVRVSRAAAEQRAGRAGRLAPGVCYRLWSEGTQRGLVPFHNPEILDADLAPLALELAAWGVKEPKELAWLDPPPSGALAQARDLLSRLGALDAKGGITARGRAMAALPLHPRLAHMVEEAKGLGAAPLACDLAALLSEREILRGERVRDWDFSRRYRALAAFRRRGRAGAGEYGADPGALAGVERAAQQWRRLVGVNGEATVPGEALAGELLALAYPDRIGRRRPGEGRYLLSGGRGAELPRESAPGTEWLVAATVDGRGDEARILMAAEIDEATLRRVLGDQIELREVVEWDPRGECVVAAVEERLGALLLTRRPIGSPDPDLLVAAMLDGIRRMGLSALPWNEAAESLRARVASLRHWFPEQGWPDWSDDALLAQMEEWLAPFLRGTTRRDHLARLNLEEALLAGLDWERRRALDEGAPAWLTVPSGSRKRLEYRPGEPPVLAVKLQEMFGLADTPRVGWGKVPVMLHLLSPGQRPIQVTQDLRGFWERTYAEVKRELKGRYPRHPWPDDPWSAAPTARAKPRGT